jgi:hypothetical protein
LFAKYENYSVGFVICTKLGVEQLEVKGPSVARKMKLVDFTIFLPDSIVNIEQYVDSVFSGIAQILEKYHVKPESIENIKEECKHELDI